MRTTFAKLVPVMLVMLAITAQAQRYEPRAIIGEPAPDLRYREDNRTQENDEGESLLEKHLRKSIVVLFFYRPKEVASTEAFPVMKKLWEDYHEKGVVIIGMSPNKKEDVESIMREHEVPFDTFYGGGAHFIYGVPSFPHVYLIDTSGILVSRFSPLDNLEERVATQLRKTPPAGADREAQAERLAKARTAQAGKDYGRAYAYAKDVQYLAGKDSPLGTEAGDLIKELEKVGKEWLEEAREKARAEDYKEACRILAELSVRFAGTDLGSDADRENSRLIGDQEMKPIVRKAIDNAKGWVQNDLAADHEAGKRYMEAIRVYRDVLDKYPDTEAATAAEKGIDRITNDPQAKETIAAQRTEDQADRWLDIGDRFVRAEMFEKARAYYELLCNTYPDSRAAAKAKERLEKLPEPEITAEPASGDDTGDETKGE